MVCKTCAKQHTFNCEKGYSREYCGPLCDGIDAGKKQAMTAFTELARQLRAKAYENEGSDAELAFEAAASSIERVCAELTSQ